ncbi:MAG: hypothetical protein ABI610_11790 [Acidobacteriota bacterium]
MLPVSVSAQAGVKVYISADMEGIESDRGPTHGTPISSGWTAADPPASAH